MTSSQIRLISAISDELSGLASQLFNLSQNVPATEQTIPNHRSKLTIQYYAYEEPNECISWHCVCRATNAIITQLTGNDNIHSQTRELLRDLTVGYIHWQEVPCPTPPPHLTTY